VLLRNCNPAAPRESCELALPLVTSSHRLPPASAAVRSALEEDSERMVSELERKVAALKGATQSIHDEVSEHNRMLAGMGDDFQRTGGMMSGAMQRLDGLIKYTGEAGGVRWVRMRGGSSAPLSGGCVLWEEEPRDHPNPRPPLQEEAGICAASLDSSCLHSFSFIGC